MNSLPGRSSVVGYTRTSLRGAAFSQKDRGLPPQLKRQCRKLKAFGSQKYARRENARYFDHNMFLSWFTIKCTAFLAALTCTLTLKYHVVRRYSYNDRDARYYYCQSATKNRLQNKYADWSGNRSVRLEIFGHFSVRLFYQLIFIHIRKISLFAIDISHRIS